MPHPLICLAALVLHAPLSPLRIDYTLTVDSAAATSFTVEMRLHRAPDTLRLAMAAHPEYDERFWRYVRDVGVESGGHQVPVVREDSALWRAVITGNEAVVRYRVEPPRITGPRGSWRAYLSSTGALLGGPQSFMYLLRGEQAPSHVTLQLPRGWKVATGLTRVNDSQYEASSAAELLDSPILMGGDVRTWQFAIDGVAHEVAYAPAAGGQVPDSIALVSALARLARASRDVFGGFPYARFVFLLQEGAGSGGLEHHNSVTLGISRDELARGGRDFYSGAAHEYVHTWNEMRLRPRGWGGLTYLPPAHTPEMWWMEGVTLHYADVLLRRAGLPTERPSRREQLESDIGEYLDNPGNALVSPEQAGSWSGDRPGTHGNAQPDYYLQGRLVGAMLDLVVRDATGNRRSLDDVMRRLYERDAGHGYTGADIQYAGEAACRCALDAFFEANVRRAGAIDFDRYLRTAGLRAVISSSPAMDAAGRPRADARVWAWVPPGEMEPRLIVTQPDGVWARTGLTSGDRIASWNGTHVDGMRDFRTRLGALQPGDSVTLSYDRAGIVRQATLHLPGYSVHRVRLDMLPSGTERQRAVRESAMLDP
ncbi:MAG: PDZ domain-containing protein [Gemmatimonadota bacterium]|nr:PDZ domain-containing protein [Gemmatimonadota bacterium]